MLFELIDKLIDRIVQLNQESNRQKECFYREFIIPLVEDFEHIHADYMATAKKYLASIEEADSKFSDKHPVFRMIQNDSVFSGSHRAKLKSAFETLNGKESYPELDGFLASILQYLGSSDSTQLGDNEPRQQLLGCFRQISDMKLTEVERKELAEMTISRLVRKLQDHYFLVRKNSTVLKNKIFDHSLP